MFKRPLPPPTLQEFNRQYTANSSGSFKKGFRIGAVAALEYYLKKYPEDRHELCKLLLADFKACKSYKDFFELLKSCRIKLEDAGVKEESELFQLIRHIVRVFQNQAKYSPSKLSPESAFAFNAIENLSKNKTIDNGEFVGTAGEDFIQFEARGESFAMNYTKLRLSVKQEDFGKAWEVLKEDLLSPESPIFKFKFINLFKAQVKLDKFNSDYQEFLSKKGEHKLSEVDYQQEINEGTRLMAGGQFTIYLPLEINDENLQLITDFLLKICDKLAENKIEPGVIPESDRRLTGYISGRVGGISIDYITPQESIEKNREDPVLEAFDKSLNVRGREHRPH